MPLEFEKQKPQPLMLGDKAHYTLSSYDPVSIVVDVARTTDDDVNFAIDTMLGQVGATREDLNDPAFLAEHFEDVKSADELYAAARDELEQVNAQYAESQKVGLAVAELTKRLQQAIPTMLLARYLQGVRMNFEQQLAAEGMTVEQFMARSGASRTDIEEMVGAQARQVAEQEAALDAYAREKKLTVDEDEFSHLLGIPAAGIDEVIKQARAAGQYEQLKDAALHAKAAQSVVAECSCTYRHETEEQAKERVARARRLRAEYEQAFAEAEKEASEPDSGFELV